MLYWLLAGEAIIFLIIITSMYIRSDKKIQKLKKNCSGLQFSRVDGRLTLSSSYDEECIIKLPYSYGRENSKHIAKQILLNQGEEGAIAAEEIIELYNLREEKAKCNMNVTHVMDDE